MNGFLPLSEALAFGGVYVSTLLGIFGFRLAVTVWHLIPKPLMGT
jgi:hypothetical protein